MLKETLVALSVATLATSAIALPTAMAKAANTLVQIATSESHHIVRQSGNVSGRVHTL